MVPLLWERSLSAAPHESEADLKGRWVILKVDDHRKEEGGDEVGHGDNNWRQVLIDEIQHEVLLQEITNQMELCDTYWWQDNNYRTVNVSFATFMLFICACWETMVAT